VGAELPLLLKAAVATIVAMSLLRGFAGPPPAAPHPAIMLALLLTGAGLYASGIWALLGGHEQSAVALGVLGVEAACASGWLARAGDDDGGGGGGRGRGDDGGRPLPGGPGVDWEAFDRARLEWERRGTPTPV
jgi:hypothetical protein